jgi:thiosulfate dehydrogenase [quinone] large subunit
MSTQTSHRLETQLLGREVSVTLSGPWTAYWIRFLSLIMGWYFLHAGLDKIVNWPFDAGWFVGGAAQASILAPIVTPFASGAGLAFVNVAVPVGQTLIGLGLVVGGLTRVAAFFGAVLMTFFYFVNGPGGAWAHGMVNGDLLALLLFATVVVFGSGKVFGLDGYLRGMAVVQNHPRLQYLLG